MNEKNQERVVSMLQVATYFCVIVALLILVYVTSFIYQNVNAQKEENEQIRTCLSYIQGHLNSLDSEGSAEIETSSYGAMLVLYLNADLDKTIIYVSDGYLMEESLSSGVDPDPDFADKITEVNTFDLCWVNEHLIEISINGYTGYASVQCWEGAENG